MNRKKLDKLAEDPRFIPGIYLYCDRWCERCAFTSRCLSYAQTAELQEEQGDDPASQDLSNEKFWERLKEVFQQTKEMIEEYAAEQGIALDTIDAEAALAEHREHSRAAREHRLTKAAERYGFMVKEWFDREADELERAWEESGQDEALEDAVEVIRWYQFFPAAKLVRALLRDDSEQDESDWQSDAQGSVKVALIGMDRSLMAWGRLQLCWPEKADSIMPILTHLETLRRQTEQAFPNARSFIRPGLDEASDHLM